MGGYGAYVWSAYFICAVVLGLNVIAARRRYRKVRKEISRQGERIK